MTYLSTFNLSLFKNTDDSLESHIIMKESFSFSHKESRKQFCSKCFLQWIFKPRTLLQSANMTHLCSLLCPAPHCLHSFIYFFFYASSSEIAVWLLCIKVWLLWSRPSLVIGRDSTQIENHCKCYSLVKF